MLMNIKAITSGVFSQKTSNQLKKLFREYGVLFCFGFIMCYLLYSSIANWDVWNPDSLLRSVFIDDIIWVQQMRWGNQLWEQFIRSYFVLPHLSLFLSCIFMGLVPVFICDIFQINNKVIRFMIAALIISGGQQFATMTYFYCCDEFSLAYLLATISAWFVCRLWDAEGKKKKLYITCAIISMILSLSMYQAYLGVSLILIATRFIYAVFSSESAGKLFKIIVIQVFAVIAGIIGYIISIPISLILYNTSITSYRGFDTAYSVSLSELFRRIKEAYVSFYKYYFTDLTYSNSFRHIGLLNIIVCLGIVLILVFLFIKKQNELNAIHGLYIVLLVVLYPLMSNIVHLMTDTGVSFVMVSTTPYIYIVLLLLINLTFHVGIGIWPMKLFYIPVVCLIWAAVLTVNIGILEMKLDVDKAIAIENNLNLMIKELDEYTPQTPIVIIGDYEMGNYPDINDYAFDPVLHGTVHDYGQFWDGDLATFNGWLHIAMHYSGTYYSWASEEDYERIKVSEAFKEMSVFPKNGSVKYIDDMIVVKMSDV